MTTITRILLLMTVLIVGCVAADKQVHHMVMFKWKEGTTEAQADAIAQALISLKEKVPNVVSLSYGKQTSTEGAATAKGYQYGLSVIFANAAARDVYLTHPAHVAAVDVLKPHLADVVVLDYDL